MLLHSMVITCPYCWERIAIDVDGSVLPASYVEDCSVCCRPILIHAQEGRDDAPTVMAEREND